MEFLSKQVTCFGFIVKPGSIFFCGGGGIGLGGRTVQMAVDFLLLEGPLKTDGKMIQLDPFISSLGTDERT